MTSSIGSQSNLLNSSKELLLSKLAWHNVFELLIIEVNCHFWCFPILCNNIKMKKFPSYKMETGNFIQLKQLYFTSLMKFLRIWTTKRYP